MTADDSLKKFSKSISKLKPINKKKILSNDKLYLKKKNQSESHNINSDDQIEVHTDPTNIYKKFALQLSNEGINNKIKKIKENYKQSYSQKKRLSKPEIGFSSPKINFKKKYETENEENNKFQVIEVIVF